MFLGGHFSLTVPLSTKVHCIHKMGYWPIQCWGAITGKHQPDRPLGSYTDFTLLVN